MSCSPTFEVIGVFVSVGIGMATGPVLAMLINELISRRSVVRRLNAENDQLRDELKTAFLGSNHARMKLLEEIQNRGDME